jgi:hypothetical protein
MDNKSSDPFESQDPEEILCDGSLWDEHDGWLVGNKKGLEKLAKMAEKAVQDGESDEEIGDFFGIKCMDDEFFKNEFEGRAKATSGLLFTFLVVLFFLAALVVGIIAVLKWLYHLVF